MITFTSRNLVQPEQNVLVHRVVDKCNHDSSCMCHEMNNVCFANLRLFYNDRFLF